MLQAPTSASCSSSSSGSLEIAVDRPENSTWKSSRCSRVKIDGGGRDDAVYFEEEDVLIDFEVAIGDDVPSPVDWDHSREVREPSGLASVGNLRESHQLSHQLSHNVLAPGRLEFDILH